MAKANRGSVPCWGEMRGALSLMSHHKLVDLIGAHWDNRKTDLRMAITDGTSDAWAPADGTVMLEHDWIHTKYRTEELLLLTADKSKEVHFQNGWKASLEDIRSMLEAEGELSMEDELCELGCLECSPPGSTCRVVVESKRSGELRLRVQMQTMCGCISPYGGIEPVEEEWVYSVKDTAKPAAKKQKRSPRGEVKL